MNTSPLSPLCMSLPPLSSLCMLLHFGSALAYAMWTNFLTLLSACAAGFGQAVGHWSWSLHQDDCGIVANTLPVSHLLETIFTETVSEQHCAPSKRDAASSLHHIHFQQKLLCQSLRIGFLGSGRDLHIPDVNLFHTQERRIHWRFLSISQRKLQFQPCDPG